MRSKTDKDYVEERSVGRRAADRGVCLYHDMCHDTVAEIKLNCINHLETNKEEFQKMEKTIRSIGKSKLDSSTFKWFIIISIPVVLTVGGWFGYNAFETVKILTRLDTHQQHMLEELSIKPIQK